LEVVGFKKTPKLEARGEWRVTGAGDSPITSRYGGAFLIEESNITAL
jgi:hypothetical protein